MLLTKLLLEQKIKDYSNRRKRAFLLNCISQHKDFTDIVEIEKREERIEHNKNICRICKQANFEIANSTEICQNCGETRQILQSLKNYEKIEYIKPGSNIITFKTDDGKTRKTDLNKIDKWLQESVPFAKEISTIILTLETIFNSRGITLPDYVRNTVISLYYNYNTLLDQLKNDNITLYNKYKSIKTKIILSLCIYYGCIIHKYNIPLEQISIILEVNISDINVANAQFKDIFKNTEFYSKFTIPTDDDKCKVKLTPKQQALFNKIVNHLSSTFTELKDKITNKNYAAIVYFITNKLNKNKILKIDLKELETRCGISTSTISTTVKSIENFYKNNSKLYTELII